jgi:hypothetical protein
MKMNKKIYIIPGWKETSRRKQYQSLARSVRSEGYDVVFKNVDWNKKLSQQIFEIEKDSVLFGFSLGALLARLIAQESKCDLVIFASMTPLRHFQGGPQEKILVDVVGKKLVNDVKENLKPRIKSRSVSMYGDKENEKGDVIVSNTDHEISDNYINKIIEIIKTN